MTIPFGRAADSRGKLLPSGRRIQEDGQRKGTPLRWWWNV